MCFVHDTLRVLQLCSLSQRKNPLSEPVVVEHTNPARPKRPRREIEITLPLGHRKLLNIVQQLIAHPQGFPFAVPVDPVTLGIPDYFVVVKNPMDLGTVEDRIFTGFYNTPQEIVSDVRLVWDNAMLYNPPGTDVHLMAQNLSRIFEGRWDRIQGIGDEHRPPPPTAPQEDSALFDTINELRNSMKDITAEVHRLRKERAAIDRALGSASVQTPSTQARRPSKKSDAPRPSKPRAMSYEEKRRLTEAINALEEEHLSRVVGIIQEHSTLVEGANEEEIEIDLEILDDATLRELQKFVSTINNKKSNSRKGAQRQQDRHTLAQRKEDINTQLGALEAQKGEKGKADEDAEVDIGDNAQEKFPSVVIEKDRLKQGTGSDSDSSSSTSTSDSDSSDEEPAPVQANPPAAEPAPAVKEEKPKEEPVVANAAAWELEKLKEDGDEKPQSNDAKLWSEFKNKDIQNKMREKEREEREERLKAEKLAQEEERRREEEALRQKQADEAERAKQEKIAKEQEEKARREREINEKREAARKARELEKETVQTHADINAFEKDITNQQ
jgi:hypothetical protein